MTNLTFVLEYDSGWGDSIGLRFTDAQKALFPADIVSGITPLHAFITKAAPYEVAVIEAIINSDGTTGFSHVGWTWEADTTLDNWVFPNGDFNRHHPPYIQAGDLFQCGVIAYFWENKVKVDEISI